MKWIGAALIVGACGGFGTSLVISHRRAEAGLRQLIAALDFMQCELQYRMQPLPELCRQTASRVTGWMQQVLLRLAGELDSQVAPEVRSCMDAALCAVNRIPEPAAEILSELGKSLGRFDLNGQVRGLEHARRCSVKALEDLEYNREHRLRSYQTLGLCAGAALAILLI